MAGWYLFLVIIVAIVGMVLLISKFKWHPFIVLLLSGYFVGVLCGMPVDKLITTLTSGFGSILGSIGIVIIAGTIIGTILEKTGAALTMANAILKVVGKKHAPLTMSLTGYIVSIPVFCDSGFVILSPINRALAAKSGVSLAVMATCLSSGLYATHCLVPPTPGPIIMAGTLNADLGLVILVGLLVSIPVMLVGYFYALKISSKFDIPANPEVSLEELVDKYGKLPSACKSFAPILLPIILIAFKSIADFPSTPFGSGAAKAFFDFIGNPVTALILGVGLAITLIPKSEKKGTSFNWISEGIHSSASILAITGAGGAFGAVLKSLPIADVLSGSLVQMNAGLLIPFIIAALLKTAMGASTVSMIVTSAMMAPLMVQLGWTSEMAKVLTLLAIGAGSMTVSHANDSYFWVVSQFSDMDTATAYKTQTGVTLVQGLTTLVIVMVLGVFFL
ncbi:H+/gluconate symporter family protein [Sphaerochaeta pleomorpha str. Grapes]|uniref:H+/gluconate symporter family protein n=1 Tax=Sphaerochaeta pleomorpha (strain ATCC BAA-1885 / DSM 22778 / Grapes) TaxID=158190 RepID=G8QQG7_SPHPG|nr:GntP family permease [Sphaerochaeta pleomorpha]AEV29812.1 H+/gluconate symporter family protein [Sphaerochaeta pleomorpha str. Grapes]